MNSNSSSELFAMNQNNTENNNQNKLLSFDIENEFVDLPESPGWFPPVFNIFLHILYISVIICGTLGNSLVLYVIYSLPRMRTVRNYFLFNIALSDLLVATLVVPFKYQLVSFVHWPYGYFMCSTFNHLNAIGLLVSSFTTVAFVILKYVSIVLPWTPTIKKSTVGWIIVSIWLVAFVITSPAAFTSEIGDYELGNETASFCYEIEWESQNLQGIFELLVMLLEYFIPLAILAFTCSRIVYAVWGTHRETYPTTADRPNLNSDPPISNSGSEKDILLTLVVAKGFIFAWLPYRACQLLVMFHPRIYDFEEFLYIHVASTWAGYSHCVYNPVIYALLSPSFKNAFKEVYGKAFCKRRDTFEMAEYNQY